MASPLLLAHPAVTVAFYLALVGYSFAFVMSLAWPERARPLLSVAIVAHLLGTLGRGLAIDFLPLTNKMESFSAAGLALALVVWFTFRPVSLYLAPLLGLALAALTVGMSFGLRLHFASPILRTLWYPLHVPLSFVAYALWAAAAVAAVNWARTRDVQWIERSERMALQGFGVWSLSMIFGGIWGVLAWGGYFLWEPKAIWSVLLWFHYASFVHVRYTPSLRERPWVAPALALVGLLWVIIAYVGTSFFFGASSHAF